MAGFEFHFHDSEVRSVEARGSTLQVVFSAAHVQRGGVAGHAQSLRLELPQATWSGELADAVGRLKDGQVSVAGIRAAPLPLPFAVAAPVVAEMQFGNGTLLTVQAAGLRAAFTAAAAFRESMAC